MSGNNSYVNVSALSNGAPNNDPYQQPISNPEFVPRAPDTGYDSYENPNFVPAAPNDLPPPPPYPAAPVPQPEYNAYNNPNIIPGQPIYEPYNPLAPRRIIDGSSSRNRGCLVFLIVVVLVFAFMRFVRVRVY